MDDYFNVQEEFNQEDPDHEHLNNFNDDEWEDINPNDDNSAPVGSSSVWKYISKNPDSSGFNVCKKCHKKFQLSTGVSSLRKHLAKHQLKVPAKQGILMIKKTGPLNEKEQKEHSDYLVQWIICDLQPFTVVDDPYFRAMIKFFCPQYSIPEIHQVKDLMIEAFTFRRVKIINSLYQIPGQCSLTADVNFNESRDFLGLTIHYIDSDWHLCNFLLDIISFSISHSGINIAQTITHVLEEFRISNKVLALMTDNESAMIVCGREIASSFDSAFSTMTFSHYRCVAHVLNLEVKHGMELINQSIIKARELMVKIKKLTRLCDELHLLCNLKNITYLKPLLDVEIRWNSTYYMLIQLKHLESALSLLAADHQSIKELYPKEDDWIIIKDTYLLLEPLERATKYLSASSYLTLGDVRFIFEGIQVCLKNFMGDEGFTQCEIAASILYKLKEYWSIMDRSSTVSAILDPRNKLSVFSNHQREYAQIHIQAIFNIYKEQFPNTIPPPSSNSTTNTRQYFTQLQRPINENFSILPISLSSELNRYLALPIDEKTEPLLWWQAHTKEYPILSKMAQDYLSIQATSIASEQAFSVAGNTITKTRNRLLPETARACLCMKSWILNKIGE